MNCSGVSQNVPNASGSPGVRKKVDFGGAQRLTPVIPASRTLKDSPSQNITSMTARTGVAFVSALIPRSQVLYLAPAGAQEIVLSLYKINTF